MGTRLALCVLSALACLVAAPARAADGAEEKIGRPESRGRSTEEAGSEEGTEDDARRDGPRRDRRRRRMAVFLFRLLDRDGDGKVSRGDFMRFFRDVDADGNGELSSGEFRRFVERRRNRPGAGVAERRRRRQGPAGGAGDVEKSPESLAAAKALREARERPRLPEEGSPAPDFALTLLEGSNRPDHVEPRGGRVHLSDHRGKRPVVLIFGSYT